MPKDPDRPRADHSNKLPAATVEITQDHEAWQAHNSFVLSLLQELIQLLEINYGELSVVLTHDRRIAELNAQYRHQSKPTNVLSFPTLLSEGPIDMARLPQRPFLLGDIILAFETITREANEQGKSFEAHLAHLLTHGLLHILGHDHIEDGDAEIMETLEVALMQQLGYDNPYSLEEA